jgi:hypothetical protein
VGGAAVWDKSIRFGGFFDFGDRQAKNQPQHITKTTNHTFPRALV